MKKSLLGKGLKTVYNPVFMYLKMVKMELIRDILNKLSTLELTTTIIQTNSIKKWDTMD